MSLSSSSLSTSHLTCIHSFFKVLNMFNNQIRSQGYICTGQAIKCMCQIWRKEKRDKQLRWNFYWLMLNFLSLTYTYSVAQKTQADKSSICADSDLVCYNHLVRGEPCPFAPWSSRTITCHEERIKEVKKNVLKVLYN